MCLAQGPQRSDAGESFYIEGVGHYTLNFKLFEIPGYYMYQLSNS